MWLEQDGGTPAGNSVFSVSLQLFQGNYCTLDPPGSIGDRWAWGMNASGHSSGLYTAPASTPAESKQKVLDCRLQPIYAEASAFTIWKAVRGWIMSNLFEDTPTKELPGFCDKSRSGKLPYPISNGSLSGSLITILPDHS